MEKEFNWFMLSFLINDIVLIGVNIVEFLLGRVLYWKLKKELKLLYYYYFFINNNMKLSINNDFFILFYLLKVII